MMLACITPTRLRPIALIEQARALAPQLHPTDLWVIVTDSAPPPHFVVETIAGIVPPDNLAWLNCRYTRPKDGTGCVNRLRNVGAAFAPEHDLVEIDDHDLAEPHALDEIRAAFDAGYEYVFGWHNQAVKIEQQDGTLALECWPTVERDYSPGDFTAGKFDAIALRAIKRSLWDVLGGWDGVWPGGDKSLAIRAEQAGASIVCLQLPLCTVQIEPERSITELFHRL